jgi:hypothetical protein
LDPRIPRALALYAFVVVGVFLLLSPWTPIWMEVTRGLLPPDIQAWTNTGWLRGRWTGRRGLRSGDCTLWGNTGFNRGGG